MKQLETQETLAPFINTLEQLGISYLIGGSIASSVFGAARSTQDIDLVTTLTVDKVDLFVNALNKIFYIDKDTILNAIHARSSFNIPRRYYSKQIRMVQARQ